MDFSNGLVLLSEILLGAYPLLIKLVDASLIFQIGLRMFVYTALAVCGSVVSGGTIAWATLLTGETLATGLLNLLHVSSSYFAFEKLSAGNAMALFYTYPVWNLLGASLVFGETLPLEKLPWILLALAGTVALAQPTATQWSVIGVVAALVAALTETGIYLWFKSTPKEEVEKDTGPWTKMAQMFGSSGLMWLVLVAAGLALGYLGSDVFKISGGGLSAILLFNSLIGFGGYALRFYMIPKVSTIVFSALSFLGVVAAYGFGWVGMSEVPNMLQMGGAAAIIAANAFLVSPTNI
jgi:drug/metabolite transporter (DMT)-like permease